MQSLADRYVENLHGPDPTAPGFGAQRFETGPALEPFLEGDSFDVPIPVPGMPSVEPGLHGGIPLVRPGVPGIEHLSIPYPTDINPDYLIDQHTDAYADPDSEAFRNLVRISIGDHGAVTSAR